MDNLWWIVPFFLVGYSLFRILTSENERIKTFFRIYKAAKNKLSDSTERELLEIVTEAHIPPNGSVPLRNRGISGKQYLDGVFEEETITLDDLIYHFITIEFPKKYPSETIEEMIGRIGIGKPSNKELLKNKIKMYHRLFLGNVAI